MLNTTGTNISVAQVAKINPPITARPSGAFCSPPSPSPSAMGDIPMIIASAVISTGRNLVVAASTAATAALAPSASRSRAKLTTRIELAVATPMHMMAPVSAGTESVVWVANSILVVSFGRERLTEHGDAVKAAIEAGFTRFRPVLMTALAMIIGMAPMALGLGEGGEQNAPLGRAVIGGLIFATIATLMFVPVVFSMVHKKLAPKVAAAPETSHAH